LSAADESEIAFELPDGGTMVRCAVTRSEFDALIDDLVERTVGPCRQALRDAGLTPADVGEVVAVGGSTRVPLVRRPMQALFGRPPRVDIDPHAGVAPGAGRPDARP